MAFEESQHSASCDAIVAISTPRGYSGLGVVRLSGPGTLSILERVFRPAGSKVQFPIRRAVYGTVRDPHTGAVIDDAIAVYMKAPASYTGEDMAELSLHGNPLILEMAVRCIVGLGARPAERGEFTRRAFVSGRLDLVQAEAVVDLIEASSPFAVQEARARLDRTLSRDIQRIADSLRDLLAELDAYIDFDEDEDGPAPDPLSALREISAKMAELRSSPDAGRIAREGLQTVIAGKPNVGKSTLFNCLVGCDRVIVTPYPGTTRDTIEERIVIGDVAFALSDAAGIRTAAEPVEEEGVRRALERIRDADLVLTVLDGSTPLDADDGSVIEAVRGKECVVVFNKTDLGLGVGTDDVELDPPAQAKVFISATTGDGIEELRSRLRRIGETRAGSGSGTNRGELTQRGMLLMDAAYLPVAALLEKFSSGRGPSLEIVSLELRRSLSLVMEITGEEVGEAVLDSIFERFCVGK
jgi:tRNA modification GTPase